MHPATLIRARCDAADRLIEAEEPLAGLQLRCGGEMPGQVAIPALLALVRKARRTRQVQTRTIVALDDNQPISAFVRVVPDSDGTVLELSQWQGAGERVTDSPPSLDLLQHLAEGHVLLDANQCVLAANLQAEDLGGLAAMLAEGRGRPWTDFVSLDIAGHRQPLHWRLLDDARFGVKGSPRKWRARYVPRIGGGFELLLVPETIERLPQTGAAPARGRLAWNSLLGRDLAPALRQPIARIIANAETIRTRLAGPLAEEYATYAADIAEAGRHLMGLVEDLADLEAVEDPGFRPAPDKIDLADCARRAAGILSVRAQERGISVRVPDEGEHAPAIGEFRRVLQVLINLLSNAIRYTPAETTVVLGCGVTGATAWISVADEGEGLTQEQADRVFDKFERLGRAGDGGSGLGLYISRRLARAMGGELNVASTPGAGACFVLSLPADIAVSHAVGR
ncbi:sensor histidine kinase [Novosphingobium sp.]|uniref:sensor histidine kinase n=1 Tax=Novosphingobium sp. TaxID=1874826 RepID=UPI0038BB3EE7